MLDDVSVRGHMLVHGTEEEEGRGGGDSWGGQKKRGEEG